VGGGPLAGTILKRENTPYLPIIPTTHQNFLFFKLSGFSHNSRCTDFHASLYSVIFLYCINCISFRAIPSICASVTNGRKYILRELCLFSRNSQSYLSVLSRLRKLYAVFAQLVQHG